MLETGAGEKQQRHDDQRHNHDRSHIRLQENESADNPKNNQGRQQASRELREIVLLFADVRRDIHHHDEFAELGRLNVDGSEMEPSPGSLGRIAERRDKDQYQQQRRQAEQRNGKRFPYGVVDLRCEMHDEQARAQPRQLTLQKVPGVVKPAPRYHGARTEHHHHSHERQHQRHG